jgi:hypothetical protein
MMNWAVLTKKQQQMVVATAVLAVMQLLLMAHFLGWTKPASARGGLAKKELLELEQKLSAARAILSREGIIRSELSQSVENLEKLVVNIPTSSDRYAWAYEYVSRCATQSRVELDNLEEAVTIEDPKKPKVSSPYAISVSTRCGYNSLVEFLWRLEKDNPLLRIKEVTITALPTQQQAHQVRMLMQWPSSVKIEKGLK